MADAGIMAPAPGVMATTQYFTVGEFVQFLGYIAGTLVFIILIGQDMRNAFKKGAHWVPGHALILSALTIIIMNFVENQSALLDETLENLHPLNGENVKKNLFMIHTTRVMLCVLVAFFLPGMARRGYEEKWTKIAALGLSVFLDIFSELSAVRKRFGESGLYLVTYIFSSWPHAKKINQVSFIVSGAIISITLIWLILLLICAAIASKSIINISSQKIPMILAEPAGNHSTWKGVENHVLKSLIVARSCDPESIIARSALASSAQVGVTICIITSVAGWIVQGPFVRVLPGAESGLKCTIVILELIFILLGWLVISWRSLSSVAYYGKGRKKEETIDEEVPEEELEQKKERWSDYLRIEDFWTRHIVELQGAEELKLRKLKVDERVSKMFVMKLRKLNVDERVGKMIAKEKKRRKSILSALLQCVVCVLRFVVFVSKVFWLLSQITLGNRYIRKTVSSIFSGHFKKVNKDYKEYKEILSNINNVLWDQTSRDVFLTNRKSMKQANGIMTKGKKDGENCHSLIPFLRERTSELRYDAGIQYLDPVTAHEKEGLKFLWRLHPVPVLDVEKYFKYSSKRSWKLTIVSLINVIAVLSPPCGEYCLQAYYEAWELIDLVESDPRTDSLLSKAADRLFTTLRNQDQEHPDTAKKEANAVIKEQGPEHPDTAKKEADAVIKTLAEKSKEETEKIQDKMEKGKDTMKDWEKAAASNALYKLCKSIECTTGVDSKELLLDELQSVLADIIGACIKRVGGTLVKSSKKWAQNLQEKGLLEAVYIAGKSRGLMEQLKWELQMEKASRDQKFADLPT